MKRIIVTCLFISFGCACEAQILKDTLYTATPAEREMYRTAIKKGRGQKAVGSLIILGGAGLMAGGGGLAIAGIDGWTDGDDYFLDEDEKNRLLWRGGSMLFLIGAATIMGGVDMIKDGRENVRSAKVCLKVTSTSVGLVMNF